jgi:hypothetical protein
MDGAEYDECISDHGPMKRKDVPPMTDGRNDVHPCESFSLEHVPMQ